LSTSNKNNKMLSTTSQVKRITISRSTNLKIYIPKATKGTRIQIFVKNTKGITYKALSIVTTKTGAYSSIGLKFSKLGKYLVTSVVGTKVQTTQVIVK